MSSTKMSIYISKMTHLFINKFYFGFFLSSKPSKTQGLEETEI